MITLLIVDDNSSMRCLIQRYVGCDPAIRVVGEAEDGAAAVALAPDLRPDVVLMDLQMPKMDGITATAALREVAPRSAVVMYTMDDDARTRLRAKAAGARAFVEKGGSLQTLLAAIRAAAQPLAVTAS